MNQHSPYDCGVFGALSGMGSSVLGLVSGIVWLPMRALESMSGYMNDLFAVGRHPEMLQPELQIMSYALMIWFCHLPD